MSSEFTAPSQPPLGQALLLAGLARRLLARRSDEVDQSPAIGMKLRIYLDTSGCSARFDDRAPERAAQTEQFWTQLDRFDACTSELARVELSQTPDEQQRRRLLAMLDAVAVHAITEAMRELAGRYVASGVFTPATVNDALHVAAAVLTRQDILVSWNYRHLVNRRRRARINAVNTSLGLPTIEIVAPPEI